MSAKRSVSAHNTKTGKAVFADSVKDLAKKLKTSRTNVSDVVNGRKDRLVVKNNWLIIG